MEIDDTQFISKLRDKIPNLIDPTYEKEQNLMKDVNIMGYFLELLEFLKQQSQPIETLILNYAQQKFHSQVINSKIKSFVTILLYSYLKKAPNSNDLSFIKRFFIQKKSNSSINFYLKLRKTIITNFSYNSRTQMLDNLNLKFDDWSTLTTRFLGAEAISNIGARVKEVNSKTRIYDKILTNSIDAVIFVQTCLELFETKEKNQQQQQQQSKSQDNIQHQSQNISQDQDNNDDLDNDNDSEIPESPDPIQQQIAITLEPGRQSPIKLEQVEVQKQNVSQKLINSLQETKYQLIDYQRRQGEAITKTIEAYEILSQEYNSLAKQNKKQNQFIGQLLQRLKQQGIALNEQDQKQITEFNNFQYFQQDPKEILSKIGAYGFAQ